MKALLLLLIATVACAAYAGPDPVQDYLSSFSPLGGSKDFYSDDQLLRIDLDLDNDGQNEVLISMARDRNGKQGNVWEVYRGTTAGYEAVGTMTFNADSFYLGKIDELGAYGLVSFWPAGGGEGGLYAHVLANSQIQENRLADVRQDQDRNTKGEQLVEKYLTDRAMHGQNIVTTAAVADVANKYGLTIRPQTYAESLQQTVAQSTPSNPAGSTSGSPIRPIASAPMSPSPTVHPAGAQGAGNKDKSTFPVRITIVAVAVLGIGLLILFVRRS